MDVDFGAALPRREHQVMDDDLVLAGVVAGPAHRQIENDRSCHGIMARIASQRFTLLSGYVLKVLQEHVEQHDKPKRTR
jgi:DNA-binding FrmR family transcriptional regulator